METSGRISGRMKVPEAAPLPAPLPDSRSRTPSLDCLPSAEGYPVVSRAAQRGSRRPPPARSGSVGEDLHENAGGTPAEQAADLGDVGDTSRHATAPRTPDELRHPLAQLEVRAADDAVPRARVVVLNELLLHPKLGPAPAAIGLVEEPRRSPWTTGLTSTGTSSRVSSRSIGPNPRIDDEARGLAE